MKRLFTTLAVISLGWFTASAQLTALNESMNSTCPASAHAPFGWDAFNSPSTPDVEGKWRCDPAGGRSGSAGVSCSGYYGSPASYHLDTSLLISPPLNLSSYSNIYLNFDSKTTRFNSGAKLELLVSRDSTMNMDTLVADTATVYNKTTGILPLFSSGDESDWVTHQVDLTPLKNIVPLYVGFRYTSASGTSGSTWYLDNINTTTTFLSTPDNNYLLSQTTQPVSASYKNDAITIFSNLSASGSYSVILADMAGKIIIRSQTDIAAGKHTEVLPVGTLPTGIYVLSLRGDTYVYTSRLLAQ